MLMRWNFFTDATLLSYWHKQQIYMIDGVISDPTEVN